MQLLHCYQCTSGVILYSIVIQALHCMLYIHVLFTCCRVDSRPQLQPLRDNEIDTHVVIHPNPYGLEEGDWDSQGEDNAPLLNAKDEMTASPGRDERLGNASACTSVQFKHMLICICMLNSRTD